MKKLLLTFALMSIAMPSYAQMEHEGKDIDHDKHMMEHHGEDLKKMDHSKMDMSAMDHGDHEMSFKQIENEMVCMVNDKAFASPQIPVEVEGHTYYGCCSMCEARLQKDVAIRKAADPISGVKVDKATSVIGAGPDGAVKYFENEENLKKYAMEQM